MRDILGAVGRTARDHVRDFARIPNVDLPEGREFEIPRRGTTWLTDIPGPEGAPAIILLHAVGCTGQLTWFPVLEELSKRYRVITFDQRWHGRGIMSEHFSIHDCADDVVALIEELDLIDPIVAGFSMGSIVAQRVWRQHPTRIGGLVLAATTAHFRTSGSERIFHAGMELGAGSFRAMSKSRTVRRATRSTAEALNLGPTDMGEWAMNQWRSTSPWAVTQAVASLGRHHSAPWLPRIDVPTAVVVGTKDHVIPPSRQRRVAELIPGSTVHESHTGHAGCVMEAETFVPVFAQAVHTTVARVKDRQRLGA